MKRIHMLFVIIFLFVAFIPSEAGHSFELQTMPHYIDASHPFEPQQRTRDYYPTDEWRTCTPEEQGMNSTCLNKIPTVINSSEWAIDSIVIIRGGYLVYELYPNPDYPMHYMHTLQSVTKSFTSSLIGIALRRGLLDSVEELVVNLFSERNITELDERKERMTVGDVLTMTSGVEWDEWTYPHNDTVNNSNGAMYVAEDSIDYFLNLPMAYAPGEEWVYNSGGSVLLGALIELLSNETLLGFARDYLFDPLGISSTMWIKTLSGYYHSGGGLYMRPRDMARLGFLYLNGGSWDGQEIIPLDYILNATKYQAYPWAGIGYGYQWWLHPQLDVYEALGTGGQRIMVSTDEDLVVVFTASVPEGHYHPHEEIYSDYIIESIIGPPATVGSTTSSSTPISSETIPSTTSSTPTSSQTTTINTITSDPLFFWLSPGMIFAYGVFAVVILFVWKERWRFKSGNTVH